MELEAAVAEGTGKKWGGKIKIPVRLKPYIYCMFCSLCNAGFNIISKVCLDKGTSRYVLVAYGCIFATPATAILAILFERKNKSKLSLTVCIHIFFLGLAGVVARILYYAGMECTSATFAGAMVNLLPSATFTLAIICRVEKVNILELSGRAKVGGTIIAFGGATVMTLYKGITVISGHSHKDGSSKHVLDGNLVKGSLLLILQSCVLAPAYILKATTIKLYPAPMRLTSLNALIGTPIAIAIAAVIDHNPSSWRLDFDVTLVAPLYCGVMIYGIMAYVNTLVLPMRGPVFVTAFFPVSTVLIAIMGLLILHEALHLGVIVGSTLIIVGLYALLWGQEYEKRRKVSEPPSCPS